MGREPHTGKYAPLNYDLLDKSNNFISFRILTCMWNILLGYYRLLRNHTYLRMQSCGSVSFRTCSIIFILEPLFDSPDAHQIFTICTISPIYILCFLQEYVHLYILNYSFFLNIHNRSHGFIHFHNLTYYVSPLLTNFPIVKIISNSHNRTDFSSSNSP